VVGTRLTSAMRLYTCHMSSSSSGRSVTCPYLSARPGGIKLTDPSLLIDLLTSFMLDYDMIYCCLNRDTE
jgi:hypothetical protein